MLSSEESVSLIRRNTIHRVHKRLSKSIVWWQMGPKCKQAKSHLTFWAVNISHGWSVIMRPTSLITLEAEDLSADSLLMDCNPKPKVVLNAVQNKILAYSMLVLNMHAFSSRNVSSRVKCKVSTPHSNAHSKPQHRANGDTVCVGCYNEPSCKTQTSSLLSEIMQCSALKA